MACTDIQRHAAMYCIFRGERDSSLIYHGVYEPSGYRKYGSPGFSDDVYYSCCHDDPCRACHLVYSVAASLCRIKKLILRAGIPRLFVITLGPVSARG